MGGGKSIEERAKWASIAMVFNATKDWSFLDWVFYLFFARGKIMRAMEVAAVTNRLKGGTNG